MNESDPQQPVVQSAVHELAKPTTKALAWGSVLIGTAALALATWRNVRAA